MARKRTIDPSIWSDEGFCSLNLLARQMFVGMISNADDDGRIKGSPEVLKSLIFPSDTFSKLDMIESRDAIATNKMIAVYESSGKKYIQIVNWWKYQTLEWHKPSVLPSPPEGTMPEGFESHRKKTRKPQETKPSPQDPGEIPPRPPHDLPKDSPRPWGEEGGQPPSVREQEGRVGEGRVGELQHPPLPPSGGADFSEVPGMVDCPTPAPADPKPPRRKSVKITHPEVPADLESEHGELLREWFAHKREKGHSFTPTGLKAFWTKIRNYGPALHADIRESMANNYDGIHPAKNGSFKPREPESTPNMPPPLRPGEIAPWILETQRQIAEDIAARKAGRPA